ncbi:hypothetical protein BDV33DRAFT_35685 [Aspergillus novoparasiticus]|uniref:Secreted protein n=1 Tax=Aspergillus novoparasiticus TaxID=986946 RepID=A0A5N6F2Y2_9EURO|nr:hypothetical protein BDV33DRAFT_35685 [Aspergillus novoparasiticus]
MWSFAFTLLSFSLSTLYFNEGEHTARSDKYDLTSRNYTTNIHLQSPTTISVPFSVSFLLFFVHERMLYTTLSGRLISLYFLHYHLHCFVTCMPSFDTFPYFLFLYPPVLSHSVCFYYGLWCGTS